MKSLRVSIVLIPFLCVFFNTPSQNVIAQEVTIKSIKHTIKLFGQFRSFEPTHEVKLLEPGLEQITIILNAAQNDTLPEKLTLQFSYPIIDIQSNWHPSMLFSRHLRITWQEGFFSNATHHAPLMVAHNSNGENKIAFAVSDAITPITTRMGVNEETSSLECQIEIIQGKILPQKSYSFQLRIDTRTKNVSAVLDDYRKWYESFYAPMPVGNVGRLPMYSSWYSFHKALNADTLLMQCRDAKKFGCEAVIIDDGWQTTDARSIYEDCGDWEVKSEIFPDFKGTVSEIHNLDMKVLLWYAVPFAGLRSKAAITFKDKLLYTDWGLRTHILDVRFPEVREHIISRLEDGVKRYNLDGLKLDFIDMLQTIQQDLNQSEGGRDFFSVEEATVKLMNDIKSRLEKLKPDILIEFRQAYNTPVMRSFGNLFRAGDCANDALENRVRTIDIRLISGNTAVHSDMLTWNNDEPVEIAAKQITNILFSVPQLSNRFDKIPKSHLEMIRFWMSFWREHRDVLLDGVFQPEHPELNYPIVSASTKDKRLIAVYANMVVDLNRVEAKKIVVVNASHTSQIVLNLTAPLPHHQLRVMDCKGRVVQVKKINWKEGIHLLEMPISGVAEISR